MCEQGFMGNQKSLPIERPNAGRGLLSLVGGTKPVGEGTFDVYRVNKTVSLERLGGQAIKRHPAVTKLFSKEIGGNVQTGPP